MNAILSFLVIVSIGLSSVFITAAAQVNLLNEWNGNYDDFFDNRYAKYAPDETLKRLVNLDKLFQKVESSLPLTEANDWLVNKRTLIELANVSPSKCNNEDLNKFSLMKEANKGSNHVAIREFLNHYKTKQYALCFHEVSKIDWRRGEGLETRI